MALVNNGGKGQAPSRLVAAEAYAISSVNIQWAEWSALSAQKRMQAEWDRHLPAGGKRTGTFQISPQVVA